ncbi:Hypothetical predicted protein [Mytilus galloprovincialis]|uniref:Uncharacterized protein n=1 Tax=Mytilus galloprovincialis TaxID=29158 RepID=A0A8B6F0I4_MYTGA|nr:Hypothetical predicted protein [Mytilus galloprovincialis]
MGETFFAEVTNQDKGGTKGTLTAAEFSHFIGKSLEQMHIRLDTERTFTYRTSRSSVYNLVENDHADDTYVGDELQTRQQSKDARTRTSGKQRLGTVSLRRNAVQKGTLGVRLVKARVNESKLLPTRKMGIPNE